jgi:hypothetical protein
MKKSNHSRWWVHVLAITAGLVIGITIRASMKPEAIAPLPAVAVPVSARSATVTTPPKRNPIRDLLFEKQGKRTRAEEATLQVAILELSASELHKLARRLGELDYQKNEEALDAIFYALGEVAPLRGLELIDQLPKTYQKRARNRILESWVLVDADAAFNYVNRGPEMAAGYLGVSRDARVWSALMQADPAHAMERALRIEDPSERLELENRIVRGMAYSDPQAALDWLAQHRQGSERKEAIVGVLRGWSAIKSRAALEYLLTLDPEIQSGEAFKTIGRTVSTELAAEFRERVPEKYRNRFWGAFVEMRANSSPSEAAELASILPEGSSRHSALYQIGSQWSFTDPVAASEWINTLPRSRSRDAAISGLAHQLMTNDPEAGATWFADMDYEGENNAHLNNTLLDWLRQDRAAATAWMDNQPEERLSPALKTEVLKAFTGSE